MTSRRALRLAGAALVTLCTSASAASVGAPSAPTAPEAVTVLLRSSVRVAPVQVLLDSTPAASTTVAALPQVPRTLGSRGIPGRALAAYRAAAEAVAAAPSSCRLSWELLAAIGLIESAHGSVHGGAIGAEGRVSPPILGPRLDGSGAYALIRDSDGGRLDGDPALDRAVGPMQFIPSTWARHGADGDGNGTADPHDLDDAALSAARYLCHASRRLDQPAGAIAAVFSYNHSYDYDYVRVVLTAAARYAGQSPQRWGVGLLPTAVDVVPAAGEPSPGEPPPQPEPTFRAAEATAGPSPAGEPSPQGEPSPESEPSPQGEPSPQSEPSPQGEPSPPGEPSPTPAAAD